MLVVTSALGLFLGLNVLLRRWRPGWRFSRADLLYLFVMLTAAGSIAGVGMTQFVVPMLSHIFHYATPGNRWEQFHPYVPMWLVPDLSVLDGFYRGETTFYTLAHIRGWLGPMIWWSVFMFAFVIFMLCMSLILRRQWVEKERLSFPIVYFPLELTRERSPLWRDRMLWVGFLVPVVLHSLGGLNSLFPAVPYLPLKPSPQLNIGSFFGAGPLEPLSGVTLAFYPMALGIGYFAQSQVLFSCWFFYWAARLSEVACIVLGYRGPGAAPGLSDMPFLYQQSLGAYWALGAVALWLGRGEIAAALKQAFGLSREPANDVGMYRAAFGGLLLTGLFLAVFCLRMGVPLDILGLLFAIYFLVVVGFSRIRASAGLPWLFGPNHPPHIFMTWAVGPANISTQALTSLNYLQWFDWDYRCLTMPHQMEALKISSSAGLKNRDVVKGIAAASIVAIVASYVALLALYYRYGAESGKVDDYRSGWAGMPIGLLLTWSDSSQGIGWYEIGGGAAGALIVVALTTLQSRWLWWPFHPVGYALSGTFTLDWLWCPLFVVWLCKTLVLRYGGVRLYRRGIPLAVGLILGDYAMAILWTLVGLVTGEQTYSIFWA